MHKAMLSHAVDPDPHGIWVLPWLLELFPHDANLAILASHWLEKVVGVETREGYLPPTAPQLANGQPFGPGEPWIAWPRK